MTTHSTIEEAAEEFVGQEVRKAAADALSVSTPEPPEERQLSVRLPGFLADELEAVADERDVSKSRLVARAVEKYLAELPPLAAVLP